MSKNIRKGNVIIDQYGHSYEVLCTRKKKNRKQDLFLLDKKTNEHVIIGSWNCDSNKNKFVGRWQKYENFGYLPPNYFNHIKKKFKSFKTII